MSQESPPSLEDLRAALQRACRPTTVRFIVEGRNRVSTMPRAWVLANILPTARECLNLSDYWEYGRLLEVLNDLGATELIKEMVAVGLASSDSDVREMAELWSA